MCKHREFGKQIRDKGRREGGVEREKEREREKLSLMHVHIHVAN